MHLSVEMFDLSPAALIAGMVVSSIGLGLYIFGKRNERLPQLVSGLLLMVVPLVVQSALGLWAIGAVTVAGLWLGARLSA